MAPSASATNAFAQRQPGKRRLLGLQVGLGTSPLSERIITAAQSWHNAKESVLFVPPVPEARRRKRILVAIQAYVDDSGGKGQGKVFVFSALVATAEEWAAFTKEWNARLKQSPSIRYFKMAEAANRNGQFRGFSEAERDTKLRELCQVLNRPSITEISCTLVLEDFFRAWAYRLGRPATEPYFFPFYVINEALGYEMLGRGLKDPCEAFFDEHVIFGPRAKAWYPIIRAAQERLLQRVMPVEPMFRSDKDILPLQGADLTAWVQRNLHEDRGWGEFQWLESHLGLVQVSPLSRVIDAEWIEKMLNHKYNREEIERHEGTMRAYKETFGFDWPPKTKLEKKRHRGT